MIVTVGHGEIWQLEISFYQLACCENPEHPGIARLWMYRGISSRVEKNCGDNGRVGLGKDSWCF